MLNQVVSLLRDKGYKTFSAEGRVGVYTKELDDKIFMVVLCAYRQGDHIRDFEKIKQGAEFKVVTHFKKKVDSIFLVVNRDGMFDDELTKMVSVINGVWLLAGDTGKIYIYENQPSHFDGDLRDFLEDNLFRNHDDLKEESSFRLTPINTLIVAINIIAYCIVIFVAKSFLATYDGDIMLKMGASSYNSFISGRYYEIITAMFLHFGISHLFNNMLLLVYIGCELEKRIGSFIYALIYMGSGIVGNIVSLFYYGSTGQADVVSAGASGAIFGVLGCLAVYLIVSPSDNRNLTTRRLIIMAVLTIYYGFTSVGIDNAAHIGGFCFGLLGGFLLSKIFHYDKIIYRNRLFTR